MEGIVNYIRNHGSYDEPVSAKKLSAEFKVTDTVIRKRINEARCKGIPICSCNNGYYYSENKVDIIQTIQSLTHRTIAVENAVNGLLSRVMQEMVGEEE